GDPPVQAHDQLDQDLLVQRQQLVAVHQTRELTRTPANPGEELLDENSAVVAALRHIVDQFGVSGKQDHDANIVATMQVHGIRRLLTHNVGDFGRYTGLIDIVPLEARREAPGDMP
ncbi:MAG: hypothetical protein M3O34_19615, partial [Chloroflexota bacterium]|nr:hypothetical protein [Chloroflexota bacterium]